MRRVPQPCRRGPLLSASWSRQTLTAVVRPSRRTRILPCRNSWRRQSFWGDAAEWLPRLPEGSVNLFFTSPPYADARSYSEIHPDRYVKWFLPFADAMLDATAESGSFVLNIKNRVASAGPLRGQRHPYVYELVLSMQRLGWRWIETYIWSKPNAILGRFGPRTKDSFEYVYHFAKGSKPYFDLDAVRVPYKADSAEINRRWLDGNGRRNTQAGFGRDRRKTYEKGGADPGNVVEVCQTYNQHKGPAGQHTAVMPEGLAAFFIKAACHKGCLSARWLGDRSVRGIGNDGCRWPPPWTARSGNRTASGLCRGLSQPYRRRRGG